MSEPRNDPLELTSGGIAPTATDASDPLRIEARAAVPAVEEVDLWWGSYSSRTLWPSWLGCLLVTGLIVWAGWYWQARGLVRLGLLGAACLLCALQLVRWANRVFGYNYRLTTRQLFCEQRLLARSLLHVPLASIARVETERTGLEQLVGVGRIVLYLADGRQFVLEGVKRPERVAETFRGAIKVACEISIKAAIH